MIKKYILVNKEVKECHDINEWEIFLSDFNKRRVAESIDKETGFRLSTVFLAIDHSFEEHPKEPILFESMMFDEQGDTIAMQRCSTYDEAIHMHNDMYRRHGFTQ